MAASKNQNYLHGAAILAVSVVIIKILGAIYKIPLGNILDDEGYGHFTVAYNIYNVLLAMSTAGLPIAVAKMISEANNLGRPNQINKITISWNEVSGAYGYRIYRSENSDFSGSTIIVIPGCNIAESW